MEINFDGIPCTRDIPNGLSHSVTKKIGIETKVELNPDAGPLNDAQAALLEETHVHTVYDMIASHFSATRYKQWPVIKSFIHSQAPNTIGLDMGCGNGKYLLDVGDNKYLVGADRSMQLLNCAHSNLRTNHQTNPTENPAAKGLPTKTCLVVADCRNSPFRAGSFDWAISVAVIHHLSTPDRRKEAVMELLRCVGIGGKILIYVWALEQQEGKRRFETQDELVSWKTHTNKTTETTVHRYYHLFVPGELEDLCKGLACQVLESGSDKGNYFLVLLKQRDSRLA